MAKNNKVIEALFLYRKLIQRTNLKIIEFPYSLIIQILYGGFFPSNAQCGEGLYLPHGLNGIMISGKAKMGDNLVLYPHVVIGSNKTGAPTIGNNVVIGANTVVIGAVHVGNNVKIAAGCSIYEDVPSGVIVLPPKNTIVYPENH